MIYERVSAILEKIRKEDTKINAFIEIYEKEALAKAKEQDEKQKNGKKLGKLGGKIIAIKNLIAVRGKKLTCGSKMLEHYVSPYDATVIERINAQEGIIIGSTNMDEFACGSDCTKSAFFPTRNPLDMNYVPGGTSGGSAAAIAAGFADMALGSDTGGSIRCPACFCGTVGIKPTYGMVSRYGLVDAAMSFDQIGPLASNVKDSQLLLDAIAGKDERDQTTHQTAENGKVDLDYDKNKKLHIAIPNEFLEGANERILKLFHELSDKLETEGHKISSISLPTIKYAIPIYYLNVFAEISSSMQKYEGLRYGDTGAVLENLVEDVSALRGEKIGLEVKRRILLGTFITTKEYQDAWYGKTLKARAAIKNEIENALAKCDVLMGPTMSSLPWKIGQKMENPLEMYLADILTVPANLAGIPASSVPYGKIGKFRPGMQVLGKRFGEGKVFSLMSEIERLNK